MHKKKTIFFLSIISVLLFAGCNNKNAKEEDSKTTEKSAQQTTDESGNDVVDFRGDNSGKSVTTDESGNKLVIEENE